MQHMTKKLLKQLSAFLLITNIVIATGIFYGRQIHLIIQMDKRVSLIKIKLDFWYSRIA